MPDVPAVPRSASAACPRAPGRPSPDALVKSCLAVLPLTRASARALPAAWRELAPADVRRCKVTRALLGAANGLRGQASADDLVAELVAWDDVLPTIC